VYGIYWLNQSWWMIPLVCYDSDIANHFILTFPKEEIDLVSGRMEDDPNEAAFIDDYRRLSRWQRFQTYIPFLSDYAS